MKCPSCGNAGTYMYVEQYGEKFVEHLICNDCDVEFDGNELPPDDTSVQGFLAEKEEALSNLLRLRKASEAGGSFQMEGALALVSGDGQIAAMIDPILLPGLVLWAKMMSLPPCTNILAGDVSLEEAQKRTREWWIKALMDD